MLSALCRQDNFPGETDSATHRTLEGPPLKAPLHSTRAPIAGCNERAEEEDEEAGEVSDGEQVGWVHFCNFSGLMICQTWCRSVGR